MISFSNLILLSIVAIGTSKTTLRARIVNGINALPKEIGYQVSLQVKDSSHFCGGSILSNRYVITAGHCAFDKKKEDILVIIGTTDLEKPRDVRSVVWVYVHEQFKKPDHHANDIALLKVDPRIKFDRHTFPIRLPKPHLRIPSNLVALASGWGSMKGPELSLSTTLKKLEVTVIDQNECSRFYNHIARYIYPTEMCTHDIGNERKGVCIGDSGGPLTVNGNVLIGIISWSRKDPDCASPLYPDVHTRVSEYVNWIREHAT